MATYYVKTGGNNNADGLSDTNAWATIAKVNATSFSAGDRILFRRGDVWRDAVLIVPSSGASGNHIVFSHYGSSSSAPTINGADSLLTWVDNGSNVWRAAVTTQPQIVMFAGVLGIPSASSAACNAATKWFWESNILYTYGTVNPTTTYAVIESATRPGTTPAEALLDFNAKNYVTIDGIGLRHSNGVAIKNYAAGSGQTSRTVKNCEVAYCADGGICLYADNFFHSGVLIDNNTVSYTNLRQPYPDGALEGITLMKADGFEITNNTIHHHYEEGIDTHGDSKNGRVHHNRVYAYAGTDHRPGIYEDGGTNVRIDHNIVSGHTTGFGMAYDLNCEIADDSTDSVMFDHNVSDGCDIGLSIDVLGGGTGHANLRIYHNTWYAPSKQGLYYNSRCSGKMTGIQEVKNNIFDTAGFAAIQDDSGPQSAMNAATITHNFFITGNSTETTGSSHKTAASVGFANAAAGQFWLLSTSTCINAGTPIFGGHNGSAPDLGAFEYPERPKYV